MPLYDIDIRDDERPDLDALLEERIYEFNSNATGIHDGARLNASINDDDGRLVAGLSGHKAWLPEAGGDPKQSGRP
jgi:hypothetical protein